MEAINLKDNQYLLDNNYIMLTKAGNPWRCGKGYRKDWSKLIGECILVHNKPYTLTNRVKKEGKWYLVFTDGTNNYTELQTKAINNKNIAKDTIIEAVIRVIAGLLPEPKELLEQIWEYAVNRATAYNQQVLSNPNNFTRTGRLKRGVFMYEDWNEYLQDWGECSNSITPELYMFKIKLMYLEFYFLDMNVMATIYRRLSKYYHPDSPTGNAEKFITLQLIAPRRGQASII